MCGADGQECSAPGVLSFFNLFDCNRPDMIPGCALADPGMKEIIIAPMEAIVPSLIGILIDCKFTF